MIAIVVLFALVSESAYALSGLPPSSFSGKKCYALAVSGGGDKGSYEAGVIKGLVQRHQDNPDEVAWNIVTGISAGSNIASGAALYNVGDEAAMADHLVELVTSFSQKDVFQRWGNWNPIKFLEHTGLVDTSPYYNTLLKTFKQGRAMENPRNVTIAATKQSDGTLQYFDESMWTKCAAEDFNIKCPDDVCTPSGDMGSACSGEKCPKDCKRTDGQQWASMVRASSAVPVFFETVTINNEVYSDGGLALGVDVFSAINRCREVVENDEDIVVDIITIFAKKELNSFNPDKDNHILPIAMRSYEIVEYEKKAKKILDACRSFPNVNWRYLVEPEAPLPSNGLNFDQDTMQEMVKMGIADAQKAQIGDACKRAQQVSESPLLI
jgi:predicted acylesterase/phospholipase RssA